MNTDSQLFAIVTTSHSAGRWRLSGNNASKCSELGQIMFSGISFWSVSICISNIPSGHEHCTSQYMEYDYHIPAAGLNRGRL